MGSKKHKKHKSERRERYEGWINTNIYILQKEKKKKKFIYFFVYFRSTILLGEATKSEVNIKSWHRK